MAKISPAKGYTPRIYSENLGPSMLDYNHILLATSKVDIHPRIVEKVRAFVAASNAKLTVLQVLERFPENIPTDDIPPEAADKFTWPIEQANKLLSESLETLKLQNAHAEIKLGSAKDEILDYAAREGVDLIVLGAHERHGLNLFFYGAAEGVVHSAHCDVFVIDMDKGESCAID